MKIRTALIWLLLGGAAGIVALIGIVALTVRLPEINAEQRQAGRDAALAMTTSVDHALAAFEEPIRRVAARIKKVPAESQRLLDFLLEGDSPYRAIYLVDESGQILLKGSRSNDPPGRFAQLNLDGYPEISARREDGVVSWSDRFLSVVSGDVMIAVTIKLGEKLMVAEISPARVSRELSDSIKVVSQALIVLDRRGEWVASNSDIFSERQTNFNSVAGLREILEGTTESVADIPDRGRYALASGRSPRLSWHYITLVPLGMSNPAYRNTVWTILLGFIGACLFALMAAPLVASRASKPLLRITERSWMASRGIVDRHWPKSNIQEIEELARNLQHLMESLVEREANLRELNEHLEQRVKERTEALSRSNSELTSTLQNLERAQDHLVRSEKMAALGKLVAGVAHELNTPIGNALMAASALNEATLGFRAKVENGLKRSDLEQFVVSVESAGAITERNLHRAADLVGSFKQVAVDQTSAQRRHFYIGALVREILITLEPTLKRIPVVVHVTVPENYVMDSYPGALGQALTNLIDNSAMHAFDEWPAESGQRQLWVAAKEAPINDQPGFIISVRDNGRGMSSAIRERIFDPFFTTRMGRGGTGLGLHIVHNLVDTVLQGHIEVESVPGQGSTFSITIPQSPPQTNESETARPVLAGV